MEEGFNFNLNGSFASEDFEVVEVGDVEEPIKPVFIKNTTDIEDILSEAINESLTVCSRRLDCETGSERGAVPYANDSLSNEHYSHAMERVATPVENNAYTEMIGDTCRLVGGSKFYEVIDKGNTLSPQTPTEKHDCMKPTDSDEEVSDVDQECTIFSGVSYLGAAVATSPRCEQEIQRTMATLSSQRESETGIAVSISVPVCSQGLVVLYDGETNAVMARYAVSRIVFYTRGTRDSPVGSCFAFTWSHGESREAAVHQCHVFRCHIAEAVEQVSTCFAKAFERVPASMTSSLLTEASLAGSVTSAVLDGAGSAGGGGGAATATSIPTVATAPTPPMQLMHVLECSVDIKEIDAKGTLSSVPKERVGFKLRGGINKQVTMTVQQMFNSSDAPYDVAAQVPMTYTGGLYIERCFGILLAPCRNAKQSDLRLLEMVSGVSGGSACSLCAWWNSGEPHLAVFNVPGTDGATVYVTLAMDIVVRGITDPIRISIETPVKIFPPTERFWYYSKRPLVQQFFINLKETSADEAGNMRYEVVSLETSGELDRSRNLTLSLSSLLPSPLTGLQPAPPSPDDDVSDGDEPLLSGTGEVSKDCCEGVLENWAQVLRSWGTTRPKALTQLVRHGVPEALRGEVWQRLAQADQHQHLMDTYRVLITKECACESVIQRDIARTFPAHEQFREAGGLGQDSLLRVARAYAVYDEEVGYCQGLSFLAATLILHMPEEQAFCVLVRLMYGYGLRDFYKDGFEALYMRLHQLQRLMEEQMGDLKQHFENTGVEPHMFASQWFLTLYTARFPLPLVFHIVDVFLLQGMDTLFQVALALLARSKRDLMQHDFEGILKYFRVTLPKKCRAEEVSRQIVKHACSIKVKRLHKYRLEFENFAKEATEQEKITTEMERLKTANSQLLAEKATQEQQLSESRLATEAALKESARNAVVARDYREICARLDRQFHEIQDIVKLCASCTEKWSPTDNKKADASLAEEGSDVELQRRVRDLELELAHVKLSHVQAQCTNQELSHKLNATIAELQSTANQKQQQAWPPWLSRTLGSIKEAAQNRPSFQTYLPNLSNAAEDTSSSADTASRPRDHYNAKRHSMIADLHAAARRNQDLG